MLENERARGVKLRLRPNVHQIAKGLDQRQAQAGVDGAGAGGVNLIGLRRLRWLRVLGSGGNGAAHGIELLTTK